MSSASPHSLPQQPSATICLPAADHYHLRHPHLQTPANVSEVGAVMLLPNGNVRNPRIQQAQQQQQPSKKKRKTGAYRRRQRRRAHREDASLTRLAAILGQIKEVCVADDVFQKVGPLVELATRIIETLSDAQAKAVQDKNMKQQPQGRENSPSEETEGTAPTASASPAKTMMTQNDSGRILASGTKIPPHVYKPTLLPHPSQSQWPSSSRGGGWIRGGFPNHHQQQAAAPAQRMSPPLPLRPVISKEIQEAAARDAAQFRVRAMLRKATTVTDFERAIQEADELGMVHESAAARAKIAKLMV